MHQAPLLATSCHTDGKVSVFTCVHDCHHHALHRSCRQVSHPASITGLNQLHTGWQELLVSHWHCNTTHSEVGHLHGSHVFTVARSMQTAKSALLIVRNRQQGPLQDTYGHQTACC